MNNDVPHITSQWFTYLRVLFSILLPSFFRDLPSAPSHELEIPINQPFIPFHNPSLPSMQPGNGGRAGGAFRGLATLAGERWRKTAAINPVCISHFVQRATLVLKAQVCDGLCYGREMTPIRLKKLPHLVQGYGKTGLDVDSDAGVLSRTNRIISTSAPHGPLSTLGN